MTVPTPEPSVWRWALTYARSERRGLTLLALVVPLEVALGVLAPWPMKVVVDHVIGGVEIPGWLASITPAMTPEHRFAWVCVAAAATVVLYVVGAALGLAQTSVSMRVGPRMNNAVAADVLAHLQRLSLSAHARRPLGDTIRRVTADSGCVTTLVRDVALPAAASAATLACMFAVMVAIDPWLGLASLAVMPPLVLFLRSAGKPLMDREWEYAEAEGNAYSAVERALTALPVIKAFGREADADADVRNAYAATLSAALSSTTLHFRVRLITGLATAVGTAMILLLGGARVSSGSLTVGGLLVFLYYLSTVYGPVEQLAEAWSSGRSAAGAARRVRGLLAEIPAVRVSPHARRFVPAARQVELRLEGVHFTYGRGTPDVLRDVSFRVAPGETLAVVGPSGAGKSTLLSLLVRLYDPTAGRVLLDGNDLRDLTPASIRAVASVVAQDPFLFPMSVAANIAYGAPTASRAEIVAAATAARAHDFIESLPGGKGYDTVLAERGADLSVGQRQRLSIARALLRDAPLLLLDEPTSALDAATESDVTEAVRALTVGRSVVVIAHRLSTLRFAHRIVVLDRGALVELGTHEQLLARQGLYARLVHQQQFGTPHPTRTEESP